MIVKHELILRYHSLKNACESEKKKKESEINIERDIKIKENFMFKIKIFRNCKRMFWRRYVILLVLFRVNDQIGNFMSKNKRREV
jgi:hypothetical protein